MLGLSQFGKYHATQGEQRTYQQRISESRQIVLKPAHGLSLGRRDGMKEEPTLAF